MHYLPLAEATVFRFLIPLVTAWACHVFLAQPFTSSQLTAGLVALLGVIIIAQPAAIFGPITPSDPSTSPASILATTGDLDNVSPAQRLLAITVSLLGVIGASGAYTTIRVIGSRTHALMSVNYFAFIATTGSAVALYLIPGIGWVTPQSARDWLLLCGMGLMGFALQFLLTTGLNLDKSPKATSMLYTQVIFALCFDWAIWGVLPGGWSLFGGAIVVASTLWSALQKKAPAAASGKKTLVDEERPLLAEQRGRANSRN